MFFPFKSPKSHESPWNPMNSPCFSMVFPMFFRQILKLLPRLQRLTESGTKELAMLWLGDDRRNEAERSVGTSGGGSFPGNFSWLPQELGYIHGMIMVIYTGWDGYLHGNIYWYIMVIYNYSNSWWYILIMIVGFIMSSMGILMGKLIISMGHWKNSYVRN